MITADRYGNALPTTPAESLELAWSVRLAFTNGDYQTKTGWTYYHIPSEAIVEEPEREMALDGGSMSCNLSLLKTALPSVSTPLEFYQLEVDLVDAKGRLWPFHTGPITAISEDQVRTDGAVYQRLESFGVLQRAKGMDIAAAALLPVRTAAGSLTGLAQAVTIKVTRGAAATTTIPGSLHTVDATVGTGSFPGILIDDAADFSSPLVYGAGLTEYTVTATSGVPLVINWGANVAAKDYYVKYWALVRVATLIKGTPTFIRVPDGGVAYSGSDSTPKRRIFDNFQTYAAAGCTTTVIAVRDPDAFKSGAKLVAVASGPTEWLTWTKADGSEETQQISSVDAAGAITVSAFSAAPAAGDPIRLSTTEPYPGWEANNRGAPYACVPRFYSDSGRTTEYRKGSFLVDPQNGVLLPVAGRHYLSASSGIYPGNTTSGPGSTDASLYRIANIVSTIGNDNRTESAIYTLLTTASTKLLATTDFQNSTITGGWTKTITWTAATYDDILQELGGQGLPPDSFLIDTPAGLVRVDKFGQAAAPSAQLLRVADISIGAAAEPRTAVAVISTGPPRNVAAQTQPQYTSSDWSNPERMFDGTKDAAATFAGAVTTSTVRFDISPLTHNAMPHISEVRIYATKGVVTATVEAVHRTNRTVDASALVEGWAYRVLEKSVTTIPGGAVVDACAAVGGGLYYYQLAITFYQDDSTGAAVNPSVDEIEIISEVEAAWTAYLTDDTSGSPPTGWSTANSAGYGSIWWQRDAQRRYSYRFAPTAYLKRVLPTYNSAYTSQRHRLERLVQDQITQDECRDRAEMLLDEYVRRGRVYEVTAGFDPRLERGDTVSLTLDDGTALNLFIWAISGGRELVRYQLMDYAA